MNAAVTLTNPTFQQRSVMKRLTLKDAFQTETIRWGKEDQPVLVCLHGLGGTALSFAEVAESLVDDFLIVAPYIPGSGGSEAFVDERGYEFDALVDWLAGVIQAISDQPVFLLGHSWGAHIALFALNRYPQLFYKQLLLDGGYYVQPPKSTKELQQEINDQITSDDDYCFDSVEAYLAEEKSDAGRWNEWLKAAAMDRMIDDGGTLRWHLSADVTAKAFVGIEQASPATIFNSLKKQSLAKKVRLLVATEPVSRTDRQQLAMSFSEQTGISHEAVAEAGHSIHISQPGAVIDTARRFFAEA